MPRHFHSSRSYRSEPNADPEPIRPARKFPVLYLYLLGGGLFAASVCITAVFLVSPPAKVATKKGGNTLRPVAPPAETTSTSPADVSIAPTDTPAPLTPANEPFSFRTANSDAPDAVSSEASLPAPSLSADDIQRKDSLAQLEFHSKNYPEAERVYREILTATPDQPLAIYHIYTCLLLQNRRDDAAKLLASLPSDQSPALAYCQAIQAFVDGDTATAQTTLAQAHQQFAALCDPYDPTLKDLGFLP